MVNETEDIGELQQSAATLPLYFTVAAIFLHSISLGISVYFTSVTVPYHTAGSEGYILLTEEQISWYLSLYQLAILIGSFFGNTCGEKFGRKSALVISNTLAILSFGIMFLAPSFPLLLIGRLTSGISDGMGMVMPIVYLSEVATIKLRSGLANSSNLFMALGTVMIFLVNMVMPPILLPFVPIGLSGIFLIASPALNESPQWLIRTGKVEKAEKVLRNLRGTKYEGVNFEIEEVLKVILIHNQTKKTGYRLPSLLSLKPFAITFILFSAIGLSGIDAPVLYYGPRMFSEFGFQIQYQYIIICFPLGVFIGYLSSCIFFILLKKKTQLVGAYLVMALSSALLGVAYWFKDDMHTLAKLSLVAGTLGLTFGYGAGVGSVSYTLPSELLNPEDSSVGIALAEACRVGWTAIIMKMYPWCLEMIGYPIMFIFHTSIMVLTSMFIIRFVPETKNKSLSELQQLCNKE